MRRVCHVLLAALALTGLAPGSARAWPHTGGVSPNPGSYTPYNPAIGSDGSGGFFLAWTDYRAAPGQIVVQHFDASGKALWTSTGVQVSNNTTEYLNALAVASDGNGGLIVLWDGWNTGYSQNSFRAQRVLGNGTQYWTSGGVVVCNAAGTRGSANLVPYGNGGAYIVWQDGRNNGTTGLDIYAQNVLSNGNQQFAANGLGVCLAAGDQSSPAAALNQYGYCGVVWIDARAGGSDIYAHSVGYSGLYWGTANGVLVCNSPGGKSTPVISGTVAGDYMVGWGDTRGGNNDVYAQRIWEPNGQGLLASNGVPVVATSGNQYLDCMSADRRGGFVFVYREYAGVVERMFAQKIDVGGTVSWYSPTLIRDAADSEYYIRAVADGLGGTLVSWMDRRSDGGDIYAQRLDGSGYPRWQNNGVPVANGPGQQEAPVLCAGATGGAFIAWSDPYTSIATRMNAVDEWGYLGANPAMKSVRDVPNDQGGQVKVSWDGSPLDTDPLFRNVYQYTVFRSVPPNTSALLAGLARAGRFSSEGTLTEGGRSYRRVRFAAQDYYWEQVAVVAAHHLSGYSAVVATEGDSIAGSNPRTAFLVMAEAYPGFWFSNADSGYSVDNVAPAAPAPFTGQQSAGQVHLHWNPNVEPDVAGYRLYRGHEPSFTPGPGSFVTALPETGYTATEDLPYYYKLTAIDSHGNESPAAFLLPYGTLDAPDVAAGVFFLAAPSPNPVTRGRDATLRFGLARAGRAELVVMDAAGRRVRTLARGDFDAGEHRATWDGRDEHGNGVAAGIYFVRYTAEGQSANKRIVRID